MPIAIGAHAELNVKALGGWVGATLTRVDGREAELQYGRRSRIIELGDPASGDPKELIRSVARPISGSSSMSSTPDTSRSSPRAYLGENPLLANARKVLYMELKQLDMDALLERAELEGVPHAVLARLSLMREPQESVCRSVLEQRGLVPLLAEPEP